MLTKHYNPISAQDYIPRPLLRQIQLQRLQKIVQHEYRNVEVYRRRMDEKGVKPSDIRSLEDIAKLPFMMKKDLRDTYPFGLFALDMKQVVRLHASSGTTGKPIVVGYTKEDIDVWVSCMMRALAMGGVDRGDIIQNSYGYGLFTGGLGAHYGGEKVGATVLPSSTGNTQRQVELIQDLGVTAIACTPSYLIHLNDVANSMGVSIKNDTKLRKGLLGAEPWSESMRKFIHDEMGIEAYDIYGTSEQAGPMFTECTERNGIHVAGDIMLVEIVDPDSGEPVENGDKGEMVVTMLQKEAMPMIRYRIRDISYLMEDECACGRTSPRIGRISGRSDDMLIVRGINVFPSQIEYTLMRIPEVGQQYMIYVSREGALDEMTVQVEIRPEAFSDNMAQMAQLRAKIEAELKKYLNIYAKVELKAPGELPRFEGKAKRVVDTRVI